MSHECCECVERLSGLNAGLTKDFNAMLVANSKAQAALQAAQETIRGLRETLEGIYTYFGPGGVGLDWAIRDRIQAALSPVESAPVRNADVSANSGQPVIPYASPLATESKPGYCRYCGVGLGHIHDRSCCRNYTVTAADCIEQDGPAQGAAPSPDTRAAQCDHANHQGRLLCDDELADTRAAQEKEPHKPSCNMWSCKTQYEHVECCSCDVCREGVRGCRVPGEHLHETL